MQIASNLQQLRDIQKSYQFDESKHPVGFVPTMGCLHDGHLSLVRKSKQECAQTIVSIFLNPMQFNSNKDLDDYPVQNEKDLAMLRDEGVDIVFLPTKDDVYPAGFASQVEVKALSDGLCATTRPGHFLGVTTVVAKLFNAAKADRAYFGQKDLQQCRIIEKMVADLDYDLEIIMCPIVREADGLAMSSRNSNLSPAERKIAPELHKALMSSESLCQQGENWCENIVAHTAKSISAFPPFKIDYLEIRRLSDLKPIAKLDEIRHNKGDKAVIFVAAFLGDVRLIDNLIFEL